MPALLRILALGFVIALLPAAAARATDITVDVPNVNSNKGVMRVFICTADEFLGDTCHFKKAGRAMPGNMKFAIKNVTPGTYAVEVYHDENENGKIDFGFLGLYPVEGYGFANLGALRSRPDFDDAALDIKGPKTNITVALHYP